MSITGSRTDNLRQPGKSDVPPGFHTSSEILGEELEENLPPTVARRPVVQTWSNNPSLPGFRLLEVLGRGGMGVVFKALQVGLDRMVAVKMMLGDVWADPGARARFAAEAEAVAAVNHPNVVRVYEFGENAAHPYLVMEYLPGGSLAAHLKEHGSFKPNDAAQLVESIARGVQAAHEAGVIHRDLKPANILFNSELGIRNSESPAPIPKVTDFGLAKRSGSEGLTLTGIIMGTPGYMAPEQAAGQGKFVGPGADIYALGIILFECLTGRLPHDAEDTAGLLTQVMTEEPSSVRKFAPNTPSDLDLICLKCLAKQSSERYPTAAALADDLARFVRGEPVTVRPAGAIEIALKWVRRHPTRAAAYALAVVAAGLTVLAAGAITLWQEADAARGEAEQAEAIALKEQVRAEQASRVAEKEQKLAQGALFEVEQARLGIIVEKEKAEHDKAKVAAYFAHLEYEAGNVSLARYHLAKCPVRFRGWEWQYVNKLCNTEARTVVAGLPALTGCAAALHPGSLVASGPQFTDNLNAGMWSPHGFPSGLAFGVAVSPDGNRVARVRLRAPHLEIRDRRSEKVLSFNGDINAVAFSPDGSRLLVGRTMNTAQILDAATGKVIADLPNTFNTRSMGYTRDGKRFFTGGLQDSKSSVGLVQVWDSATLQPVKQFTVDEGQVTAVAVNPSAEWLVAGAENGVVRLWHLPTGREMPRPPAHAGVVRSVGFHPTKDYLVTAGNDRSVHVWDVSRFEHRNTLRGHAQAVGFAAFSTDGQQIVTAADDGVAKVWPVETGQANIWLSKNGTEPQAIAVSLDGSQFAVAGMNAVQIHELRTGQLLRTLGPLNLNRTHLRHVAFGDEGATLTAIVEDGSFTTWDVGSGMIQRTTRSQWPGSLTAISANGTRGAFRTRGHATTKSGEVEVIDLVSGHRVSRFPVPHNGSMLPTALSANGSRIATGGDDCVVRVWDANIGHETFALHGHTEQITAIAFSPDGRRLVSADAMCLLKIWDYHTGQELLALHGPGGSGDMISAVAFSPDGSRLLAITPGGRVKVFDGETR